MRHRQAMSSSSNADGKPALEQELSYIGGWEGTPEGEHTLAKVQLQTLSFEGKHYFSREMGALPKALLALTGAS